MAHRPVKGAKINSSEMWVSVRDVRNLRRLKEISSANFSEVSHVAASQERGFRLTETQCNWQTENLHSHLLRLNKVVSPFQNMVI
jgi:hypothetical protein